MSRYSSSTVPGHFPFAVYLVSVDTSFLYYKNMDRVRKRNHIYPAPKVKAFVAHKTPRSVAFPNAFSAYFK